MNQHQHRHRHGIGWWLVLSGLALIGLSLLIVGRSKVSLWKGSSRDHAIGEAAREMVDSETGRTSDHESLESLRPSTGNRVIASDTGGTPPTDTALARVTAISENGTPLANVLLQVESQGRIRSVGETSSEGIRHVLKTYLRSAVVYARRSDKSTQSRALASEVPDQIEVVLGPGGTIVGQVQTFDGSEIPPGIRVVAAPIAHRRPDEDVLIHSILSDPRVSLGNVDQDGGFEIHGLEPSLVYELAAGGAGWVSSWRKYGRPSSKRAIVGLEPLFGVAIRARDKNGSRLNTNIAVGLERIHVSGFPPDSNMVERDVVLLAGADVGPELSRHEFASYFSSRVALEEMAPVLINVGCAGYLEREFQLNAHRVIKTVPVEVVELSAVASGWGSIAIDPIVPDAWTAMEPGLTHKGTLTCTGGAGQALSVDIKWVRGETISAAGIPYGRYTMQLRMAGGIVRSVLWGSNSEVEIGPKVCQASLDLRDSGAIGLQFIDKSGASYVGRMWLTLQNAAARKFSILAFDQAPYCVLGIEPGSYEIFAALADDWPRRRTRCNATTSINGGEIVKLVLNYDD